MNDQAGIFLELVLALSDLFLLTIQVRQVTCTSAIYLKNSEGGDVTLALYMKLASLIKSI